MTLAVAVSAAAGFPPPKVHDEHSYVLSGDTFAEGRLTNPTHPMWQHFETFHVLQRPSYSSKYPPAQGLFLALGERIAGRPRAGVWLAFGMLAAAFNWMLLAWTRPRWAFWGAVGAALWLVGRHAMGGYWAITFWGGSVPALGGALLLGGVRRLDRVQVLAASLATGIGLALLATSRPVEGLAFAVFPLVMIVRVLTSHVRAARWRQAATGFVPMTAVLVASALFVGLHNYRVTGHALTPPYAVYEAQYASSPSFIGQARPPMPEYRVPEMRRFYSPGNVGFRRVPESASQTVRQLVVNVTGLMSTRLEFGEYFLPVFAGPLILMVPFVIRGVWSWMALGSVASVVMVLVWSLWETQPHYAAPAAAAWALLLTLAARNLSQMRSGKARVGRNLVMLVFACISASALIQLGAGSLRNRNHPSLQRQAMERSLANSGRHLVIVEYGPRHDPNFEWVYNRASIDAAPVVWARSLGAAQDSSLREYFADRTAWRLVVDADTATVKLSPVPTLRTERPSKGSNSR